MKRFFTFAIATALAAGLGNSAWSQSSGGGGASGSGGTGGAGTSGTAGTSGAAGSAGTAGAAGTPGTAGAAGTPGTSTPGTAGTPSTPGAAGRANLQAGQNANARAQVGTDYQFNGINRTPFFTDPGVRQQLNLNDNQYNQLNRAYQDAYSRYNERLQGLGDLNDQQRMEQYQRLRSQFYDDFGTNVNSTFTDPQARNRFNQLNWQYQGPNAFTDPRVQRQLNLTAEQQRQIRELGATWRQQMREFRLDNRDGRMDENWTQFQRQYQGQLQRILTPQQLQTWGQLIGQPYNYPRTAYFNGRATAGAQDDVRSRAQRTGGTQAQREQQQAIGDSDSSQSGTRR